MTSPAPGAPVLVGTSWKMNKTLAEAVAFVDELVDLGVPPSVEAFVLPAHTALAAVRDRLPAGSGITLGAQNAHWAPEGAGTGEVSMRMVGDAGASLVEIGHSERRTQFGESDDDVARKVAAALEHGLTPLVCVGEPGAVRDAGDAEAFVRDQVASAISRIDAGDVGAVVFAYEPVWAIGESGTAATPEQVAPVMEAIRQSVRPAASRVLYGGSVDETNAVALLQGSGADGLFVGRAAWSAAGFARLLGLCAAQTAPTQTSNNQAAPTHPARDSTPLDREVDNAATR